MKKQVFLAAAILAVGVVGPVQAGGEATYKKACIACHGNGVAGSPKVGDKAAWKARIAIGKEVMYTSAIKGKGAMPAKGGQTAISDADIKAAVDYMISQSK